MVLPLVLLAGSGISVAVGAVTSATGARKIRKAQSRAAVAHDRYAAGEARTQASLQRLNARAATYGDRQSSVAATTVNEFVTYLQTHGRVASADGVDALESFTVTPQQVKDFEGLVAEVGNVALGATRPRNAATARSSASCSRASSTSPRPAPSGTYSTSRTSKHPGRREAPPSHLTPGSDPR